MSDGSVAIMVFGGLGLLYFGSGMLINFLRSGGKNGGTPTVPNADFWRSLPGLVAEGCAFTVCQVCGTRTAGSRYARFGGGGDSYGSL